MPNVSVVIPTYNRSSVLPRAIDSVLAQKGTDLELIIVDDGSTEMQDGGCRMEDEVKQKSKGLSSSYILHPGSSALCAEPSIIRFFRQEKNSGPAAARNFGIKKARGEWIAFLDSDDEWKPGKLKAQLEFFFRYPDYLICQTEEIWIRNGTRVNPMKKHQKSGGWIFEKCLPLCVVSPSAVMMHRKLFDEIGLFDESLPACEDYDLWLRIAAKYPIGLIEKPYILKYGGHADQRSREFPAMDRFRIRSLAKILKEGVLTREQTAAVRATLEKKSKIYLAGALKRENRNAVLEIESLLRGLE